MKDSSWKASKGSEPEKANSNAARTLKRFMTRKKNWSDFYWAQIPLYNPKTKAVSQEWLPFLLPHEFLSDYFCQEGAVEEAMPAAGTYRSQRLAEVCKAWESCDGSTGASWRWCSHPRQDEPEHLGFLEHKPSSQRVLPSRKNSNVLLGGKAQCWGRNMLGNLQSHSMELEKARGRNLSNRKA